MLIIRHYLTKGGVDLVTEWLHDLRDIRAKAAIVRRINRLELGNFGDHKALRDGVHELRIDLGPGYRLYYARAGDTLVLLLCGGDKRGQGADIDRACACWRDWKSRSH
ncbi:type II toxin-antitoxin system RelE/ParE family toxin [Rhizobium sp. TRM95796]|uniref:type II toxin-antitoxin system RelE/ParE family toxin n=1 Tax=Rhizobium sp. TRM95796 TaxID=2979862 RepID=UPI0021E81877|nr:type II toxin-antitoxin system RelE/ParE family toxin [Rhizobium sp. TRM95796]MCV3766678.1 type II toxin-antitoxin system RelE/ParE family toxin [Rhizobium sp. TRM95796]